MSSNAEDRPPRCSPLFHAVSGSDKSLTLPTTGAQLQSSQLQLTSKASGAQLILDKGSNQALQGTTSPGFTSDRTRGRPGNRPL